jgi:hypothetical protein
MRLASARLLLVAMVTCTVAATTGCGGGGGGGGGTSILTFAPSTDLTLVSDGSPGASGLAVGDTAANLTLRTGLRFGIFPFLPVNATIDSAQLQLRQTAIAGVPYTALGSVLVDRVDFGLTLSASDFSPTVLTTNIGTLSNSTTLVVKELDVTAAVQADHAANALTSDFLLRFTSVGNVNATADTAVFEDQENTFATGVTPLLVVTYH